MVTNNGGEAASVSHYLDYCFVGRRSSVLWSIEMIRVDVKGREERKREREKIAKGTEEEWQEESHVAEKETGIQKSLRHPTRLPSLRLYSGNGLSEADVGCSCLIHQHHYPPPIPGVRILSVCESASLPFLSHLSLSLSLSLHGS